MKIINIKMVEGKSRGEVIDFLFEHLPQNISLDELYDIADLAYGVRNNLNDGNKIVVSEYLTVEIVRNIDKETE